MSGSGETESEKNQDFHLYLRLVTLLNDYGGATLRDIFRRRYENLINQKWEDGSQASKDFHENIGRSVFKSCKPIQQIMLQKGDLDEWDLALLSTVLQRINFTNGSAEEKVQHKNENKAIKELIKVRNSVEHLPGKSISVCDFNIFWKRAADNLVKLHVSLEEIDYIRSCANIHGIEFKPTNADHVNAENYSKAKGLRDEGNAAASCNELNKALQLYTKALNLYGVPQVERGIIYSNRSSVYLKLLEESAISSEDEVEQNYKLAKADAEKVIELRSTWCKGYYRLGRVLQFKKEWESALIAFDQALGLNIGDKEILNARDACRFKAKSEQIQEHIQPLILQNKLDTLEICEKLKRERGEFGSDSKTMFKNMQLCEDSNDPELKSLGYVFFAHRHSQGIDGYEKNYKKAAELFSKAAKIGNAEALFNMGKLHQKGMGVATDFELAAEYFEKAAKHPMNGFAGFNKLGVVAAQYALGRCYHDGVGKPKDFSEAARWYSLASENGSGQASNNLALLYSDGFGVEKSQEKAIQYWKLAASQGEMLGTENLAYAYLNLGNLDAAENYFSQSISAGNLGATLEQKRFQELLRQRLFMLERTGAIRGMPVPLQKMLFGEYNDDNNTQGKLELPGPNQNENGTLNIERSREASLSPMKQTNPMRIQIVLIHRKSVKEILISDLSGSKLEWSTLKPINEQKLPSQLTGLKEITLGEMNPTTDHVYSSKVLHATIMEDCIFDYYPSIHTVIKDDNGDFIFCYFYNFNQKDVETRKKFSFGSRISILNPYHRLTADLDHGIRIDDPQSVVFHSAGDDAPICRFCCKPDPSERCSKCKRANYCSRNCQLQDWNMLKHKFICRPLT